MEIYSALISLFAKIGLFSFGGGYAMLPLIYQNMQDVYSMSAEEFGQVVALSQITPGPIAVNAATYVGFVSAGLVGAVVSTVAVTIPSFIIMLMVSSFLKSHGKNEIVDGVFSGIRPATVGLIASASIILGQASVFTATHLNIGPAAIAAATLIMIAKFKISPITITVIMGVVGAFVCS